MHVTNCELSNGRIIMQMVPVAQAVWSHLTTSIAMNQSHESIRSSSGMRAHISNENVNARAGQMLKNCSIFISHISVREIFLEFCTVAYKFYKNRVIATYFSDGASLMPTFVWKCFFLSLFLSISLVGSLFVAFRRRKSKKKHDPRKNKWSNGCVFFFCLTWT